jgi:hypothetical protein
MRTLGSLRRRWKAHCFKTAFRQSVCALQGIIAWEGAISLVFEKMSKHMKKGQKTAF